VGWHVSALLKEKLQDPDITVTETALGGLSLIDLLTGYGRAVIIDAIKTGKGRPGQIYQLDPQALGGSRHTNSTHGIDFPGIIKLGQTAGLPLPQEIIIFAVEVEDVETFGETCSPAVEVAIPKCAEQIIAKLTGP
jgi:hydrogenase maturation protease